MKTRRTEIRVEKHEIRIVRLRNMQDLSRCQRCDEMVTPLTHEQTAEILATTPDEVFRLLDEGCLHLVNPEHCTALICLNSFFRRRKPAGGSAFRRSVLNKE